MVRKNKMKKSKLVILRGSPTSGKSTAFHGLKNKKEMRGWLFVDFCNIKEMMGETLCDDDRKHYGQRFLFAILKEAMKSAKNIILEEMSEKSLRRSINHFIKKYNYEIVTFQFTVRTDVAHKRDVQRAKDKWHPFMGKELVNKLHKYHDKNIDPNGIVVDTNKLGKKVVVDFILEKLGLPTD